MDKLVTIEELRELQAQERIFDYYSRPTPQALAFKAAATFADYLFEAMEERKEQETE